MSNHVWIVEVLFTDSEHLGWQPTTDASLARADGKVREAYWSGVKVPDDKVRLRKYERHDKTKRFSPL